MRESQGIQSVEIGVRVLSALAAAPAAVTLKDLAASAGMSASKAHRYLASFVRAGLVRQDAGSLRYDLGPLALELGLAALGRIDAVAIGGETLTALGAGLGETVFLAVWGNRGPTIVRWLDSAQPVTVNVRVGSVLPLLTSATGRAFLGALPPARTAPLIAAEAKRRRLTARSVARLEERIRKDFAAHGLGRVDGDLLPGVAALAVPVFDHAGAVAAVLTALGPQGRFDARWTGRPAEALRAAAAQAGRRLGLRSAAPAAARSS